MKPKPRALLACLLLLLCGSTASAHRIDEYLQATVLSVDAARVHASVRLIPGVLVASSVIAAIDANGDGVFSPAEQHRYAQSIVSNAALTLDGQPLQLKLISFSFPQPAQMRDGLGEIHVETTANLVPGKGTRHLILANRHLTQASIYLANVLVPETNDVRILAQQRNADQSVYEVDFQQSGNTAAHLSFISGLRSRIAGVQFASLFHLGMQHIAEGTDHLLFLITLLLPAPLLAAGARWGRPDAVRPALLRVFAIVTAFTLGHSATLTLSALGFVHVPEHPVEVLIAVSILFSAVHALRPVVAGKEAWIAAFFGLIHGLAFAATLQRLGLGLMERICGILAFNLGIETMQALVVLALLPSLLLLSHTRIYPFLRTGMGVLAATAALGWTLERLLNRPSYVDPLVNAIARHGVLLAVLLFALSLALWLIAHVSSGTLAAQTDRSPATTAATSLS